MSGPCSSVLICHAEEPLHHEGLARWLHAKSGLRGIVMIHDTGKVRRRRLRREWKRSGTLGLLDVLAFRAWYQLARRNQEHAWREDVLRRLRDRYPALPADVPTIHVQTPNSPEAQAFVRDAAPDVMLALCKYILKPAVFTAARTGTFVLHPGICPEYRNAHGCFWAIVRDDDRVGMTLLKIDEGIDTGPIYGYFTHPHDLRRQSHIVIQNSMTFENLEAVWECISDVCAGRAAPMVVDGRASAMWGQPRLTPFLAWRWRHR